MSVMSQTYSIIIDRGISAPGHGKEVADGINAVDKRYIYQLMSKVQLPGLFRLALSDDIKQYSATTTAHRKLLISLLKNKKA